MQVIIAKVKVNYIDNKRNGILNLYYESGQLKEEKNYADDKLVLPDLYLLVHHTSSNFFTSLRKDLNCIK